MDCVEFDRLLGLESTYPSVCGGHFTAMRSTVPIVPSTGKAIVSLLHCSGPVQSRLS